MQDMSNLMGKLDDAEKIKRLEAELERAETCFFDARRGARGEWAPQNEYAMVPVKAWVGFVQECHDLLGPPADRTKDFLADVVEKVKAAHARAGAYAGSVLLGDALGEASMLRAEKHAQDLRILDLETELARERRLAKARARR